MEKNMEVHSPKFPETAPSTYKAWMREDWKEMILEELEKLLLFVRWQPISGLEVSRIRVACYTPVGEKDLYNRKVWLYMNEIDAYQNRYEKPVDEDVLEEEWKLSGLERPMPLSFDHSEEWVLDENQQWRMLDSRGKYI